MSEPKAEPASVNTAESTQPEEEDKQTDVVEERETKQAIPGPDQEKANNNTMEPEDTANAEQQPSVEESDNSKQTNDAPATSATYSSTGAPSEQQRVAIITGANSGIGLVATEKLAKDGYEVIMACRSEEKASEAVKQVQRKVPGARVSFMKLDLSSLQSVREFADAFHATGKPLHALCNNAGLTTGFSIKQRFETEDGFEMAFGVNHLGHFLLTNLLLDVVKKTAKECGEARIIHTSSMLHDPESAGGNRGDPAHLDFDNLMMEKPGTYDGSMAYKNSKLANCAFSVELAKRLEGSNVTSNTLCPGFIPSTGFGRNETMGMKIRLAIFIPILKLVGVTRTVEHGGGVIHDVATNSSWKGVSGKHCSDFNQIDSSKESRDPEVCKKLWDISADLVKYEQAKAL